MCIVANADSKLLFVLRRRAARRCGGTRRTSSCSRIASLWCLCGCRGTSLNETWEDIYPSGGQSQGRRTAGGGNQLICGGTQTHSSGSPLSKKHMSWIRNGARARGCTYLSLSIELLLSLSLMIDSSSSRDVDSLVNFSKTCNASNNQGAAADKPDDLSPWQQGPKLLSIRYWRNCTNHKYCNKKLAKTKTWKNV